MPRNARRRPEPRIFVRNNASTRPDLGWNWLELSQPQQDIWGYTDDNRVVYPPTLRWRTNLTARRTDGKYVYVSIPIDPEVPERLVRLWCEDLANALATLEEFRTRDE